MIALKLASLLALVAACFLVADAQLPAAEEECPLSQVCFVIDQSGSINDISEYMQEQTFVVEIAKTIKDIVPSVQLSAVAFANQAELIQPPTDNLAAFSTVVNGPRFFPGGGTAMALGLQECFDPLLPLDGNRIIVLVTDGVPNSKPDTIAIANQIRDQEDMFLVTVGIGLGLGAQQFLEDIAHAPEFVIVTDFAGLMAKVEELVELICEVVDPDDCEDAYEECMFQFKGETGVTEYDVKPFMQDTPFTPSITPKDPTLRLGALNTRADCPPEFITDTGAVPITQFGMQPFTPTHFKPYWVSQDFCSGIGHQTFHSNQGSIAKDKCIRVYFTSYQLMRLDSSGNKVLIDNFNDVPKSENKCVVFKTKA